MNMKLKQINVVVLFVADLDRAKAFYRDTLGLGIKFEDQDSAALELEPTMLHLLSIAGASRSTFERGCRRKAPSCLEFPTRGLRGGRGCVVCGPGRAGS